MSTVQLTVIGAKPLSLIAVVNNLEAVCNAFNSAAAFPKHATR